MSETSIMKTHRNSNHAKHVRNFDIWTRHKQKPPFGAEICKDIFPRTYLHSMIMPFDGLNYPMPSAVKLLKVLVSKFSNFSRLYEASTRKKELHVCTRL